MAGGISGTVCDVKQFNTDSVETMLRTGRLETCRQMLDSFLDENGFWDVQPLVLRMYMGMNLYITARSFSRELGVPQDGFDACFGGMDDITSRMETPEDAACFFEEMVRQCIRWRIELVGERSAGTVRKARDYIDRNYMHNDLSLGVVADAVGLSPTYFSALFKREVGVNFSDYLADVRIQQSKTLLCCTSKLVCEIAYEVGFRDYRYFSQIFKKHTGLTPKQFQSSANRLQ